MSKEEREREKGRERERERERESALPKVSDWQLKPLECSEL